MFIYSVKSSSAESIKNTYSISFNRFSNSRIFKSVFKRTVSSSHGTIVDPIDLENQFYFLSMLMKRTVVGTRRALFEKVSK